MTSLIAFVVLGLGQGAMDARLMRFPDIHEGRIVFTYAGDLWLVPEEGGIARKITNHPGNEYMGRFSPDGSKIAFNASYDGNRDVFVIPSEGGEPKRLTFHPDADTVVDWMPDGGSIIFRSSRESAPTRYQKAFTVPVSGGTAKALPMDESGLASPSPDATKIAYNRVSTENASWKRYRGGLQSFISFFDIKNVRYSEMPHDESAYLWPMWVDHRVFYANDADGTLNLYSYDTNAKKQTRLTDFHDYDVKWPGYGSGKIVFERDAKLWTYDIATKQIKNVPVRILTDLVEARPYRMELGGSVSGISISPSAVRLALEARGELFSVPVKEGLTQNITKTPGVRERYPRWSPDGKWILFASDKSGEYVFYVQKADLTDAPAQVTHTSADPASPASAETLPAFTHAPTWSPDSKKFFYTDSTVSLYVVDVEKKETAKIGQESYPSFNDVVWSPDSKWLAYSKNDTTGFGKIYLYSLDDKKETKISDGMFDDQSPLFDADGKYLFFVSARDFNPTSSYFELSFNLDDTQRIFGLTLRTDTPSPFAPKNEQEEGEKKPEEGKPKKEEAKEKEGEQKREEEPKPPDLGGMSDRLFNVPVSSGSYALLASAPGKLFYRSGGTIYFFDLKEKKSQTVIEGVSQVSFTPKADKLAYMGGGNIGVVAAAPGQRVGDGKVSTADMEAMVDPRQEWKQSYWEAWRFERDYFWAPNMAGIDWRAMGEKYAKWVPYLGHRSDLDYLLRELLGELATSHAYVTSADVGAGRPVPVGLLGADYEPAADGLRFKKVYRGQMWESSRRGPLNEPGMNVKEGDYLVAIDGDRVGRNTNVDELMVGKADKLVEIAINSSAAVEGSRKILVKPIASEAALRYADWVDGRRKYVEEKTGGRVAYVHVPSTGTDGVIEFFKMFYPQVDRDAIIVDERYNSGGFIPDFFTEKLKRDYLAHWKPRNMDSFRSPNAAIPGPKVMLINRYGGSGGDAFPLFFRKEGLGPLIGTRTWGGLVGIMGFRDLMAGGGVTVPQFAIWDVGKNGKPEWVVENVGVYPDIEVDNRPDLVFQGKDPQLDKAIEVLMEALAKRPPKKLQAPPFPNEKRSPGGT